MNTMHTPNAQYIFTNLIHYPFGEDTFNIINIQPAINCVAQTGYQPATIIFQLANNHLVDLVDNYYITQSLWLVQKSSPNYVVYVFSILDRLLVLSNLDNSFLQGNPSNYVICMRMIHSLMLSDGDLVFIDLFNLISTLSLFGYEIQYDRIVDAALLLSDFGVIYNHGTNQLSFCKLTSENVVQMCGVITTSTILRTIKSGLTPMMLAKILQALSMTATSMF